MCHCVKRRNTLPLTAFFIIVISIHPGNEVIGVDSAEVRASVNYLHIIDNQQTLFELSHKLEPRA